MNGGVAALLARVYPRACGGTPPGSHFSTRSEGLSPRMRGNLDRHPAGAARGGSIPAHAGEPGAVTADPASADGSIPAHAGEPNVARSAAGSIPAHAGEPVASFWSSTGLSPRMRGNHSKAFGAGSRTGGVYPRACGGTRVTIEFSGELDGSIPAHAGEPAPSVDEHRGPPGLSPRMRGNLRRRSAGQRLARLGSIPAHAGEPTAGGRPSLGLTGRVYPRACGGTVMAVRCKAPTRGSIPAHAGEPSAGQMADAVQGSIPAHAGEPLPWATQDRGARVYPRACGGT